jgi:bifunctional non-homologous end joining protein LigD
MTRGRGGSVLEVDGHELVLTRLDKVLYPECGFTKGQVIDYYVGVAAVMLPHLADRALTRVRFPDGVGRPGFFEKSTPRGTPDWVTLRRLPSPGSTKNRDMIDYVVVSDLATLVWLANLAALELHSPQWRIEAPGPDRLVVDLDPGAPAGIAECCDVASLVRDRLAADGLRAYPKTSGKKGLQLYCPISGEQPAGHVNRYAKGIATELALRWPDQVVSKMDKELRVGKVLIDWSQNNAAKTTIAPYSLRAGHTPTVSTPLDWDEVAKGSSIPGLLPPAWYLIGCRLGATCSLRFAVPGPGFQRPVTKVVRGTDRQVSPSGYSWPGGHDVDADEDRFSGLTVVGGCPAGPLIEQGGEPAHQLASLVRGKPQPGVGRHRAAVVPVLGIGLPVGQPASDDVQLALLIQRTDRVRDDAGCRVGLERRAGPPDLGSRQTPPPLPAIGGQFRSRFDEPAGREHAQVMADVANGLPGALGEPADRGGPVEGEDVDQALPQRVREGCERVPIGHRGRSVGGHAASIEQYTRVLVQEVL